MVRQAFSPFSKAWQGSWPATDGAASLQPIQQGMAGFMVSNRWCGKPVAQQVWLVPFESSNHPLREQRLLTTANRDESKGC
jgi:hypothetical protein